MYLQMFCDKARAIKEQRNPEVTHVVKDGKITVLVVHPDNIFHVDFGETGMKLKVQVRS